MVSPPFFLQIVDANGVVIRTHAGGKHEAELNRLLTSHIVSRGVGLFRSSTHVEQDIREGISAALLSLKVENPNDIDHGN